MNYKDNLQAWKALVITAKTGSVSQSAVLLDMDLSKVSRLLSGLEDELGFQLFDKKRRPLKPTDKCRELLSQLEPLVNGFIEICETNAPVQTGQVIRFAAPIELARLYYSRRIYNYSQMHPELEFVVQAEITPEQLRNGEADLAIVNQRPANSSGMMVRPYITNSTPVFATPEYLDRYGCPETPEDLKDHFGLLQKTINHDLTQYLYKDGVASSQLRWKKTFVSHDQMTLKSLLMSHHGISVDLSIWHVIDEIKTDKIIPILPGWERASWTMCALTRLEDDISNSRLRHFAEWLISEEKSMALERTVDAMKAVSAARRRYFGAS